MSESELEKAVKEVKKNIVILTSLKKEMDSVFGESKETRKEEEREFQLQMLEYQRGYDTFNAVLTVIIGIGFSLAIAIIALSFTSIGESLRNSLTFVSLSAIAVSAFSTGVLVFYHKCIFPKSLDNIRKGKFSEKKITESNTQ